MFNFIKMVKDFKIPFLSSIKVYFDLGTSVTRIAIKNKGVVLEEPTFLGFNIRTKDYIFIGQEAKNIVGKTPEFLKIIRPVINGIISDFDAEVALVKKFIEKSVVPYLNTNKFIKPNIHALTTYPSIATEIEQKAVEEALFKAGCSSVDLIEKPLVTASGCGFNILSHEPNLIIDLGGGLIEISIISGGGIVSQKTIKNAGEQMDKIIANYAYLKHGIILGERTCEELKINLMSFNNEDKILPVRGKSLETGLPKSVKIRTGDIKEALFNNFYQIIDLVKELVEVSPPEIVDEIFDHGIFLVGGLASIKGISGFFSEELKIKTYVNENYAQTTIKGLINLDKHLGNNVDKFLKQRQLDF